MIPSERGHHCNGHVSTVDLRYLDHEDKVLARLTLLTPQTVSTIINNLERAEAIVRRPHQYHGRVQQIEISETGKALLARCRERVQVIEKKLAEGLSQEEESIIRKWLVRIATAS